MEHSAPKESIHLGVIGCGGFGLFALQQFMQVPGVEVVGMAATHRPASLAALARFGVENADDIGDMLRTDRRRIGNIRRGRLERFSLETLVRYLARLRWEVELRLSAPSPSAPSSSAPAREANHSERA